MQYLGGKFRIKKDIAEVINHEIHGRQKEVCTGNFQNHKFSGCGTFVSLFCGSCAVETQVSGYDLMLLNDNHPYLIALWRGLQSGYTLPDSITREQYYYIREHKDDDPVLAGFAGFAWSFGGIWFGSYAQDNKYNRNYADVGKRGLLRDIAALQDACFLCRDYKDVPLPPGAVIYADPPYASTIGYTTGKFDSAEFWAYAREVSKTHVMYISEMRAPEDFVPIWEKRVQRSICKDTSKREHITEKLYVHESQLQEGYT